MRWTPYPIRLGALWIAGGMACAVAAGELNVEEPLRTLRDPSASAEARTAAVRSLSETGRQASEAVEGLLEFATDRNGAAELRTQAVRALTQLGLQSDEEADRLFQVLADATEDADVRWAILAGFGERQPWRDALRPALLEVMRDPSAPGVLRRQALFCLQDQSAAEGVAEAWLAVLEDVDEPLEFRMSVLERIRGVALSSPEALAALERLASSPAEPVSLKTEVIRTLGTLKEAAHDVWPGLLRVLMDAQAPVSLRLDALSAINNIDVTGPIRSNLVALAVQTNVPTELRRALASMPSVGEQTLPGGVGDWLAWARDPDQPTAVRRWAARSMARSAPADVGAVEFSMVILGESTEDLEMRLAAGAYLRRLGPAAGAARDRLKQLVADPDQPESVREVAGATLVEIARGWLGGIGNCSWSDLQTRLSQVDDLGLAIRQAELPVSFQRQSLNAVDQVRGALLAERQSRWGQRLWAWVLAHRGLTAMVILAGCLAGSGWFWIRKEGRTPTRPVRLTPASVEAAQPPAPMHAGPALALVDEVLAVDNPDRSQAVETLAALGDEARAVVPRLVQVLDNPDEETDLRFAALTVLGLLGPIAATSQPALERVVVRGAEPLFVRLKAMEILFRLKRDDTSVIETLVRHLSDTQEPLLLRMKAGELLAELPRLPEVFERQVRGVVSSKAPPALRELAGRLTI